ncbi:hypothetical protein JW859_09510 [bacterium]|nr:hypothetical protein [bacterium]
MDRSNNSKQADADDRARDALNHAEQTEDSAGEDTGATEVSEAEEDYVHRHEQKVKLTLAVLQRRIGKPLDTDVYFGNKLLAMRGTKITKALVLKLRYLEPAQLKFTNEDPAKLPDFS